MELWELILSTYLSISGCAAAVGLGLLLFPRYQILGIILIFSFCLGMLMYLFTQVLESIIKKWKNWLEHKKIIKELSELKEKDIND